MAGAYPTRIPFMSIYDRYATQMPDFIQKLDPPLFCEVGYTSRLFTTTISAYCAGCAYLGEFRAHLGEFFVAGARACSGYPERIVSAWAYKNLLQGRQGPGLRSPPLPLWAVHLPNLAGMLDPHTFLIWQVLEELAERDLTEVIPMLLAKIKQWEVRQFFRGGGGRRRWPVSQSVRPSLPTPTTGHRPTRSVSQSVSQSLPTPTTWHRPTSSRPSPDHSH